MTTIPGFTAEASLDKSETQFMSTALRGTETRNCYETRVVPAAWESCFNRCFYKCRAMGIDFNRCLDVCYAACTQNF